MDVEEIATMTINHSPFAPSRLRVNQPSVAAVPVADV